MAIRNAKLGGTDFADGEVLFDYDLDDTNNAIIDNSKEGDGFIIIDNAVVNVPSTTSTLVKTYTFNKAVDGIKLTLNPHDTADYTFATYTILKKNNTTLTSSNVIPITRFYVPDNNWESYWHYSNYIKTDQSTNIIFIQLYIDEPFEIGDELNLELRTQVSSGNASISKVVIEGIKNKTTNNDWVTIS